MYVGPWQEFKLFQLMALKQKHTNSRITPSPRPRNSSNDSKASDNKSASGQSIAESTASVFTQNATSILKGYYNQWKEYDTQTSFAKRILEAQLHPPALSESNQKAIKHFRKPPLAKKANSRKVSQKDKIERIKKMRTLYGITGPQQNLPPKPPMLTKPNLDKLDNMIQLPEIAKPLSSNLLPVNIPQRSPLIKISPKAHKSPKYDNKYDATVTERVLKLNNPSTILKPVGEELKEVNEDIQEKEVDGLLEWAQGLPEELSSTFRLKR